MRLFRSTWPALVLAACGCMHSAPGLDADAEPIEPLERNSVRVTREGWHAARLGKPILFPFGRTVTPTSMLRISTVAVDGEVIESPEFFYPRTNPGYSEVAYVFRPHKAGNYRVEITLDHGFRKETRVYSVTVLPWPAP
jgi:hypothetical protein